MLGILNKVFDPTKRTLNRYEKKRMKLMRSEEIMKIFLMMH